MRKVRSLQKVTKKTSHKKRKKRTRADYLRLAVFCVIIGGFVCVLISQQLRLTEIRKETKQIESQTARQEERYEELEKKAQYSASKNFYEEKARDEGYVLDDEIVFVVGN